MREISMTFTPDGTGHCLYHEEIDLHELGSLECTRASNVEFDPGTQCWAVTLPGADRAMFSSPSRQACLDWEREHLTPVA
jgi:hypothetical protein